MKSILLLPLEFATWQQARAWSYTGSYAFYDGFCENGITCTVLPLFCDQTGSDVTKHLDQYKSIINRTFDEVWVWSVHTYLNKEFWQWVGTLAPVVVGVLMESLQLTEAEIAEFGHLKDRKKAVFYDLKNCTHALVCGEADAQLVRSELGIHCLWYPAMVPEKFVRFSSPPPVGKASFIGSCYGERHKYLKNGLLDDVLYRPHLPERDTAIPEQFDITCARFRQKMAMGEIRTIEDLSNEFHVLKTVREQLFNLHLDGLRLGSASVNLPSILKTYAGRVIESMAAGVPVISWLPPGNEQQKLFIPEQDILTFDDVPSLRQAIEKANEPSRTAMIGQVINARNKLLLRHTARIRTFQFDQWLDKETIPNYFSDKGYRPSVEECIYYNKLFNESPSWSQNLPNRDELSRWEIIRRYMDDICKDAKNSREIVEVGCGRGWLSELVAPYGKVTAVEPVADVALRAAQRGGDVKYVTGSAETLLFLNKQNHFDIVLSSEVIEHVPAEGKVDFIYNLVKLTKPGGHIIVSTPRADIQSEWMAQYGDPSQPIESWMSEKEMSDCFGKAGCEGLELHRAFLMEIYQVWLFKKKDGSLC